MEEKLLKKVSKTIEPTVRIGKNGLNDNTLEEIKKQLKIRKLIKIKFLKAFIGDKDKKKVFEEIAEKTNSKLVDSVGFTMTLYKG